MRRLVEEYGRQRGRKYGVYKTAPSRKSPTPDKKGGLNAGWGKVMVANRLKSSLSV